MQTLAPKPGGEISVVIIPAVKVRKGGSFIFVTNAPYKERYCY